MKVSDRFVLPEGLVLSPIAELPAAVRARLEHEPGDFSVTRSKSRTSSKVIDADTAALLKAFQSPRTIVEAVLEHSRLTGADPRRTLRDSFPAIQRFLGSHLLVKEGSEKADAVTTSMQIGEKFDGYEILASIQTLEDTELYRAKAPGGSEVAIKILRPRCSARVRERLSSEAAILTRLAGTIVPGLIHCAIEAERPYLVLAWIDGADAAAAAAKLRGEGNRKNLSKLCLAIVRAYARLHSRGVVHGDVHPGNVRVSPDDSVTLIDFGLARTGASRPHRGGVGFYFEPEYAVARKSRRSPPLCTQAGEQYAVAALLYFLLTGSHYYDFSFEKNEMLTQIAEEPPVSFLRRGLAPAPAVEAVLGKALSKAPRRRYRSVLEFHEALVSAFNVEARSLTASDKTRQATVRSLAGFVSQTLQQLHEPGFGISPETAPTASLNYGAAGTAYALYRFACGAADPKLLALADIWACRAEREALCSTAFYHEALGVTRGTAGLVSPYHTESGVHAVRALVARSIGNIVWQNQAVQAFIATSSRACSNIDLTLGRSGSLLACAILRESTWEPDGLDGDLLTPFGDRVARRLLADVARLPPISESRTFPYLGIAHGWAGVLYALLRWSEARHADPPPELAIRLEQLAACAEIEGNAARWKKKVRDTGPRRGDYVAGWCNGSAGFIHLWTLGAKLLRCESFGMLAEMAAEHVWANSEAGIADLCCGLSGQSYGLLNIYKHSGDNRWLVRARTLAVRAAEAARSQPLPSSLYKGGLGAAILASEFGRPESSCMPFFEQEGWPA